MNAPHKSSLHSFLHRLWCSTPCRFLRFVSQRFNEANILQTAGSLTFTTLLALVPLLTVILIVLAAFPMFGDISAHFMDLVHRIIVPSGASAIADYLDRFKEQAVRMTALGIAVMAVTSLLLIQTIDQTLNRIWRVQRGRPWWISLTVYWALLTIGPMLVGISLSVSAYGLTQNTDYFFSSSLHFVGNVLGNAVFLFLLYRLVPNCHVPLLHAVAGALIIGLLLETAKYGFGIYISHFNSYAPVYGGFSIIPIFLIWLNLLWLIILSGALVIACIGDWHSQQGEMQQPDHVFNQIIAILLLLADAQQHGKALTLRAMHQQLPIGRSQIEILLLRLAKIQYVTESKRGWLLKTSPEQIWLSDLFHHFVYRRNALPQNPLLNERMTECCQPLHINIAQLYRQQ